MVLYLLLNHWVGKGHFESVASSVVGIGDLCDRVAALSCKREPIALPVQTKSNQDNIFWDLAEVDRERPLCQNGA